MLFLLAILAEQTGEATCKSSGKHMEDNKHNQRRGKKEKGKSKTIHNRKNISSLRKSEVQLIHQELNVAQTHCSLQVHVFQVSAMQRSDVRTATVVKVASFSQFPCSFQQLNISYLTLDTVGLRLTNFHVIKINLGMCQKSLYPFVINKLGYARNPLFSSGKWQKQKCNPPTPSS